MLYELSYAKGRVDVTVTPDPYAVNNLADVVSELMVAVRLRRAEADAVLGAAIRISDTPGMTYVELPSGAVVTLREWKV